MKSPDIGALAMTSKSLQKIVHKLKLGPYVKRCLLEQGPPGSIEGCEHLFENIIGLFSSVAAMATRVNSEYSNYSLHSLHTFPYIGYIALYKIIFDITW